MLIWAFFGVPAVLAITYSWVNYNGDISFERLASKGYDESPTEYSFTQAVAPMILLTLTRLRIPASTSLLLLALFSSSSSSFLKVVLKSMTGYGVSFATTLVFFTICYRWHLKDFLQTEDKGTGPLIVETIASC